jgi:hypothetical protein
MPQPDQPLRRVLNTERRPCPRLSLLASACGPPRGFGTAAAWGPQFKGETSVKLTDAQMMLLSAASRRNDHRIELPKRLNGGAAQKAIGQLLRNGLAVKTPATESLPV